MNEYVQPWPPLESDAAVLTVAQCYEADQQAERAGIATLDLMETAGTAVAQAIMARRPVSSVSILCGPGNNGGDGFVVARHLKEAGWDVSVELMGSPSDLKGDAAQMAARWEGETFPLTGSSVSDAHIVVDALFGAGLTRPLDGAAAQAVQAITDQYVVAVDVPSGLHGDSAECLGDIASADLTVTFFRAKPAHSLAPHICGETIVADIGIPAAVLAGIEPKIWTNEIDLWKEAFPWPGRDSNKFSRGMLALAAGVEMTGAARLAARAGQRVGAGYLLMASPEKASTLYRVSLESVVVKGYRDTLGFTDIIGDERVTACLIGPGLGTDFGGTERVLAVLRREVPTVLDADALNLFSETPDLLLGNLHSRCILTPHLGEFKRLFPDLTEGSPVDLSRRAAQRSGAVIVLKGADTAIAHPDGRVVITSDAPSDLATAGTGDVLAGMIAGILAQTGDCLRSAAIGCWLHSEAARRFGAGLIAEDLNHQIPEILTDLRKA